MGGTIDTCALTALLSARMVDRLAFKLKLQRPVQPLQIGHADRIEANRAFPQHATQQLVSELQLSSALNQG